MKKTEQQDFLIENIISENLIYLIEDNNISMDKAMDIFYSTEISAKLEDIETGYYLEGSAYIYELVKRELKERG